MHGPAVSGGWNELGAAWRITAAYVVVGGLWILLSDRALDAMIGDPDVVTRYQTVKGWFYIVVSAMLLYALVLRGLRAGRRQGALIEGIVESTTDSVFVKDLEGRYVMVNGATADVIGRPAREIVGRRDDELVPPALAERLAARDRVVLETGRAHTFEEEVEVPGRGRRVLLVEKAPHRDPTTGRVVGVIGISQDITARVEAEQRLRESEQRYRLLAEAAQTSEERFRSMIEHAADPIAILGAEGTLDYGSPAFGRVLGYEPGDLVGTNAFELVHPDDAERVREAWGRVLASPGESVAAELHLRRRDGSWCALAMVSRNLLDHPAVDGVIVNARDVTAQHAMAEQLRQAQKMEAVGRLAGGVAHDFNNLLTAILANAEFAMGALPADAQARADLAEVVSAAKRAAGLTRQLLAFSRKQVMQPQQLELNVVVTETERLLRRVIPENVEIVTRLDPALPPVRADRTQIEQVLLNLVTNARDALPEGGVVILSTAARRFDAAQAATRRGLAPGDYVELVVRDTGVGMDDVTRSHLFEPFFTTKDRGRGTGLGLATVYGIVKQSGGYIYVDSAPWQGSAFTILLPAEAPPAGGPGPNANGAAGAAAAPAPRASGTVLLVEDDPAVRAAARRTLEGEGYVVLTAGDAAEALALWEGRERLGGRIDLLLSDLVMPGLDGRTLAARLRERRPGLRVIFMSGYASGTIDPESLRTPGTALIDKPFEADALMAAVGEAMKS